MMNIEGTMDRSVVDDIIRRLLQAREESSFHLPISEEEIGQLCVNSSNIFLAESSLLQPRAPIRIASDIHGQYVDLLRLFECCGYPPECSYLFLGNYVDFGSKSLETICLLLAYKIRYPNDIFLLRGNHEDAKINCMHGFYHEIRRRLNVRLWKFFIDCFNCLPIAALIQDKILCMHGGLSPHLHDLDQIREIQRPIDIPFHGLLFDLLWSEPNDVAEGWGEEVIDGSISVNTFGCDKVEEFLVKNDMDLICRGNKVVEDGFEYFFKRQLLTVFSAPNFRGKYDNAGAILHVDEASVCSFNILKASSISSSATEKPISHSSFRARIILMELSVVDDIIRRMFEVKWQSSFQVFLSEGEIRQLCVNARNIFLGDPSLLQLKAPIRIVGDINGQYWDLLRIFEIGAPPEYNYLFLGNYVDFGTLSLETICLLLAYKIRYPNNIFLLRGNHEDAKVNSVHGLYDECKRRFNVRVWNIINDCFNCLPFSALIGDKILCMHGGLSPELHNFDQIKEIERPTEIPHKGLLFDLLWSKPNYTAEGWGEDFTDDLIDNWISINTFGCDKVHEFLDRNGLDLIVRGHKVVEDGYEFFAGRRLITLFSATNFRMEHENAGAMLRVDEDLMCAFEILKPGKITTKPNNGSSNPRITTKSKNPPGVDPSTSKAAAGKTRSVSPGFMKQPNERMNKSNIGSNNVTANPKCSQHNRPFKIDPATLYRSESPGVKRFLGARV